MLHVTNSTRQKDTEKRMNTGHYHDRWFELTKFLRVED